MKKLNVVRQLVEAGGTVSALIFLPALILVSIVDIVGRRFLQYSSTPLQELAWHFFFACVMFGLGYTYIKDRHVRVDILRERLSAPVKAWLERILLIFLLLPVTAVLIWFGTEQAWMSYAQGEGSRAALGLSARWIVKSTLPLGSLLLFLAGCYRLVRPLAVSAGRGD
jgi:TRAP-type mannitol/chloroaromatic compound transport system permease small subunit